MRASTTSRRSWRSPARFWASGGTYIIEDGNFVYIDLLSIEPHMIDTDGVEKIVRLDETTYVYHSRPRNGVVNEYTHRRID